MPPPFETSTFEKLVDKLNRPEFTCTGEEAEELLKIARERIAERKDKDKAEQLEQLADELLSELLRKGAKGV